MSNGFPLPVRQENVLLYVLAAIQFTHILDFMIVMPLGPRLMEIFRITPAQFGLIVSTYTFSAGLFGLIAAWFLDRFDRKRALLCLYGGFGLGTLACAFAPNYHFLVVARFLAGGFGGVAGATILAIIGDAIPPERRGAAMGTLFSSFSLASIAGVPAGLFLANHLGWHAPFFLLAGLSAAILVMAAFVLPPMRQHLARVKDKPWEEMKVILSRANHWRAFALTVVMTMAGFLIIPYISPSLVANVGVSNDHLPFIYLFGGGATFFSMRWLGKLSDRLGLLRVFTALSIIAAFPILILSHLPPVPLWTALIVTTCFMVFTSGRFIPGMAMVTNTVHAQYRGGFMSINSAFQQFASGLASLIAGSLIAGGQGGRLENYGTVGWIGAACLVVSIFLARRLRPA
ncbi:MAG: sugar transporter [Fibrobacteres bacterium]|nr:sugar transporter [Fibrobacterota bacterium]